MNPVTRLVREFGIVSRILDKRDLAAMMFFSVANAHDALRSRNLASVDAAMSRNLFACYKHRRIYFPLKDIDGILADHDRSYTFGSIREMYAHDCYLKHLNLSGPIGNVLDLGANRGMFTLLALIALEARLVVGVEPLPIYDTVVELLLRANHISSDRVVRYHRFITSPTLERQDPLRNISIDSICKQQGLDRIALVKIDIEGFEKDLFSKPEWLARVDNIAMELHSRSVGDLSVIPNALREYGFEYCSTEISGKQCDVNHAMYLYASRTGALL